MKDQSLLHNSKNSGKNLLGRLLKILGRTSHCYKDRKSRKTMCLEDQFLCGWVLTSTICCTKFQMHSALADSLLAKSNFSSSIVLKDQSLFHKPRNLGTECTWWTNSFVGQYLHQLSLVQSSKSIQRMQTVPWPKQFFLLQFFGRTSLSLIQIPNPFSTLIHLVHADSPMTKTGCSSSSFRENQS